MCALKCLEGEPRGPCSSLHLGQMLPKYFQFMSDRVWDTGLVLI